MAASPLVSGYGLNYGLNYGLPGPSSGTSALALDSIGSLTRVSVVVSGASWGPFANVAANSNGSVPASGSTATILDPLKASASGRAPIGATSERGLENLAAVATGSVNVVGASSASFLMDGGASGVVKPRPSRAQSDRQLNPIQHTSSGAVVVGGASDRFIAPMGSNEFGAVTVSGRSVLATSVVSGAAGGEICLAGRSVADFDNIGSMSVGGVSVRGAAGATFEIVTGTAKGDAPAGGQSQVLLQPIGSLFDARVAVAGRSVDGLRPLSASASGRIRVEGSSASALAGIAGSATAIVTLGGSSHVTFGLIIGEALGGPVASASSSARLGQLTGHASASVVTSGNSARRFGDLGGLIRGIVSTVPISFILPGDVRILDVRPNWSGGYSKSFEFKTDVITSRSGKEQRRALRQTPREELNFVADLDGLAAQRFDAAMMGWMTRRYLVVDHPRTVLTSTPLPPHSSSVSVNSVPTWLVPGIRILLQDGEKIEHRVVVAVDGLEVFFAETTFRSWPTGSTMSAARMGRLGTSSNIRKTTSDVGRYDINFAVEPASDAQPLVDYPARQYRGSEVFEVAPNWVDPFSGSYTYSVDELDFGRGVIDYFDPVKFRQRQMRSSFLGCGEIEIDKILGVFHRAMGRRGSFFMPSWQRDMDVAFPIAPGSSSIIVRGDHLLAYLDEDSVHQDVAIMRSDRSFVCRRIESLEPYGSYTQITFDEALPTDLTADDVVSVSWLYRWRFASDKVEVEYVTDSVAQCQLTFLTLESDQ